MQKDETFLWWSILRPTPQSQLHIRELLGITSTKGNARLQELGQKFLCFHTNSVWPVQMITAESKRVAASSLMVLRRVTDPQCVLHQIYQVGSPGLSAVGQPNARTGAVQTTNRLLILEHFGNFITQNTKNWAGFVQSIQGVPQLLPTIYPHSFNWIECKSHSSAEPDTKVMSRGISSEGLRTNFLSPCLNCNS